MPGPDLDAASKTVARFAEAASEWGNGRFVATLPADPASANALFDEISAVDLAWHHEIVTQTIPWSEAELERVASLYRGWGEAAQVLLDQVESFSEGDGPVAWLELLRNNLREVRGILTRDEEFFDDERLIVRQQEAIDAHVHGETWPLEGLFDGSMNEGL